MENGTERARREESEEIQVLAHYKPKPSDKQIIYTSNGSRSGGRAEDNQHLRSQNESRNRQQNPAHDHNSQRPTSHNVSTPGSIHHQHAHRGDMDKGNSGGVDHWRRESGGQSEQRSNSGSSTNRVLRTEYELVQPFVLSWNQKHPSQNAHSLASPMMKHVSRSSDSRMERAESEEIQFLCEKKKENSPKNPLERKNCISKGNQSADRIDNNQNLEDRRNRDDSNSNRYPSDDRVANNQNSERRNKKPNDQETYSLEFQRHQPMSRNRSAGGSHRYRSPRYSRHNDRHGGDRRENRDRSGSPSSEGHLQRDRHRGRSSPNARNQSAENRRKISSAVGENNKHLTKVQTSVSSAMGHVLPSSGSRIEHTESEEIQFLYENKRGMPPKNPPERESSNCTESQSVARMDNNNVDQISGEHCRRKALGDICQDSLNTDGHQPSGRSTTNQNMQSWNEEQNHDENVAQGFPNQHPIFHSFSDVHGRDQRENKDRSESVISESHRHFERHHDNCNARNQSVENQHKVPADVVENFDYFSNVDSPASPEPEANQLYNDIEMSSTKSADKIDNNQYLLQNQQRGFLSGNQNQENLNSNDYQKDARSANCQNSDSLSIVSHRQRERPHENSYFNARNLENQHKISYAVVENHDCFSNVDSPASPEPEANTQSSIPSAIAEYHDYFSNVDSPASPEPEENQFLSDQRLSMPSINPTEQNVQTEEEVQRDRRQEKARQDALDHARWREQVIAYNAMLDANADDPMPDLYNYGLGYQIRRRTSYNASGKSSYRSHSSRYSRHNDRHGRDRGENRDCSGSPSSEGHLQRDRHRGRTSSNACDQSAELNVSTPVTPTMRNNPRPDDDELEEGEIVSDDDQSLTRESDEQRRHNWPSRGYLHSQSAQSSSGSRLPQYPHHPYGGNRRRNRRRKQRRQNKRSDFHCDRDQSNYPQNDDY